MVHASAVHLMPPLTGEPDTLALAADRYLSVAEQIRAVSRGLADLADRSESFGRAADALDDRALDLADDIDATVPATRPPRTR